MVLALVGHLFHRKWLELSPIVNEGLWWLGSDNSRRRPWENGRCLPRCLLSTPRIQIHILNLAVLYRLFPPTSALHRLIPKPHTLLRPFPPIFSSATCQSALPATTASRRLTKAFATREDLGCSVLLEEKTATLHNVVLRQLIGVMVYASSVSSFLQGPQVPITLPTPPTFP